MLYYDTKELPVGWNKSEMLGSDIEDDDDDNAEDEYVSLIIFKLGWKWYINIFVASYSEKAECNLQIFRNTIFESLFTFIFFFSLLYIVIKSILLCFLINGLLRTGVCVYNCENYHLLPFHLHLHDSSSLVTG